MKTINTTIKILSIASNQTDSIKIDGLLTQVKSLNFQLNKIQDIENIFDSIQDSGQVILWALDRYESTNAVVLLKIQNINNSCNIPLIIILAEADFRHKYSIAGVNYCLVWNEITPALLEKTILSALQHQHIKATAELRQENLELISQLSTTKDLFQTIVNNTSTFIWVVDVRGNFTFLNQARLSFTGQTLAKGLQENWLERIHPDDIAEFKQAYQSALKNVRDLKLNTA